MRIFDTNNKKFTKILLIMGQSLFEVVIAVGVAAVILVGIVSLSTISVRNTDFSKNNALATKFAQEGSEWLRQQRDTDWDNFMSSYSSLGYINLGNNFTTATSTIDTIFSRRFKTVCNYFNGSVTSSTSCGSGSTANSVDVSVEVLWTDGNGTHTVKNITTLTRWRN